MVDRLALNVHKPVQISRFVLASETSREFRPLTYAPVRTVQTSVARPVVILGDLKDSFTEDLMTDFPDKFGTCIPRKLTFVGVNLQCKNSILFDVTMSTFRHITASPARGDGWPGLPLCQIADKNGIRDQFEPLHRGWGIQWQFIRHPHPVSFQGRFRRSSLPARCWRVGAGEAHLRRTPTSRHLRQIRYGESDGACAQPRWRKL